MESVKCALRLHAPVVFRLGSSCGRPNTARVLSDGPTFIGLREPRLMDPSATGAAKAQGNFKRRCLYGGSLRVFFYGVFTARFAREGLQGPHPPGIRGRDPAARRHAGAVTE
jgi:hypothetical protein